MKEVWILAILVGMSFPAVAQQVVARISVSTEEEVKLLNDMGLRIEDARIESRVAPDGMERYRVIGCLENGFVTVVGGEEQLAETVRRGFRVERLGIVADAPLATASSRLDTIPYQFGWPRGIVNGNSLYENSPTVADMDRNGQLDISITNAWGSYPSNFPYLIVWRRNGAYLAGFPVALQAGVMQSSADGGISAMGDIFGDQRLEIVCGDENGFLYAFNPDGSALTGFPVSYGSYIGVFSPALADFDGDEKGEIAVISHAWDSPYGNAFLHLYKVTSAGPMEMPGFPIDLQRGAQNSPAIGDLDGDGDLEIVVGTGGTGSDPIGRVIAFTPTGQVMAGFPFVVGGSSVGNSPTLYDVTNDGKLEILIRMKPDSSINGIYAIDYHGLVVPGYPFPITYGNSRACVAVGDMDGDNVPELAYGGVEAIDSGKVWVYNLAGSLLPGYPARVYRTWVDGSVAIADVDGDGLGDVVCGTNGVTNKPGLIRAFNMLGQEVTGFPLSPGNPILNSFETHPTLVDIDGDGDTEIFAGRLDKFVYGWDTPGLFDSTKVWTTFKGNAARTGGQLRSPVVSVGTSDVVPGGVSLDQNYPNPFNPQTIIRFQVPAGLQHVSLQVFDVLGRGVATLVNELLAPGVYTVGWDARNHASGTYVCRLQAGGKIQSRKLLLVK